MFLRIKRQVAEVNGFLEAIKDSDEIRNEFFADAVRVFDWITIDFIGEVGPLVFAKKDSLLLKFIHSEMLRNFKKMKKCFVIQ